ncbi:DNA-directed RNA polymerase subunit alpha [Frankliniella fusca]|uniref:DNA-directed RNA polymerase subunit alpha n=1 Tax=Frankliniella fusca TaxID=407009 RepID=A0AAE1HJ24_9NEOP|nr:DNA-directed RNA polymerase subunit alpha [Frankliniella fusca]
MSDDKFDDLLGVEDKDTHKQGSSHLSSGEVDDVESQSSSDVSVPSDIASLLSGVSESSGSDVGDDKTANQDLPSSSLTPSTECRGRSIILFKKKETRRFQERFLKRRKVVRKSGATTTDAEQSETYDNLLTNVLPNEITEGEDSVSAGYVSTLPPSDLGEEDGPGDQQDEGSQFQSLKPVTKKPRKKKAIGRKSKYSWKKKSDYNVSKDDNPLSGKGMTADVGISVDEELGRNSLASLPLVQENYALISDYLRLTLPDSWTLSILKQSIIISEIVKPENPVIRKAISCSVEGIKILVVGMPLPPSHLLWQLRKPDIYNCGSVADYLTRVVNSFSLLNICTGVLQYENLWEKYPEGVVQKSFDVPCLRHVDCSLLLGGVDICTSCKTLRKKLYDRALNASSSAASDGAIPSTTNIKHLERKELVQKLNKLQKEKKYFKERVKRLEERISKLIKEKSEIIDSELSADFVSVMNNNADKMTPFQTLFWQQQSLALSKSSAKGMRWHPAVIRLALHLRMLSPTAYDFLQGVISLPSRRRLFDYSQCIDIKEGVQQEFLDQFSITIAKECLEDHQKNFYLLLDEMSIRSDLVYNSRTGELIGFTNLSSVEAVLQELEDEMKGIKQTEKKLAN